MVKCKECRHLLDVPTNPYPVCDYRRRSNGGLMPIDPDENIRCKKYSIIKNADLDVI